MGWYKSGQKESENYKDGHGRWTLWYENGQMREKENYKDGKLMSAEAWKPNGEKCPVTNLNHGNVLWLGGTKTGRNKRNLTTKEGKEDGLWFWWHENGQKQSEINFKDGKRDGLSNRWYENGQKRFEYNFKEGKEDGLWVWWYENGQKEIEGNFKDGKRGSLVLVDVNGTEDNRQTEERRTS